LPTLEFYCAAMSLQAEGNRAVLCLPGNSMHWEHLVKCSLMFRQTSYFVLRIYSMMQMSVSHEFRCPVTRSPASYWFAYLSRQTTMTSYYHSHV